MTTENLNKERHWSIEKGFAAGGLVFALGLGLQIACGPVRWQDFAWPVNIILLAVLLSLIALMFMLRKRVYAFRWMMHGEAAVASITWALGLTMIMGLVPQLRSDGVPWLSQMLSFWPFVLVWTWLLLIDALACINHMSRFTLHEIPFILNHLGVFIAIVCAALGNPDMKQLQMTVYENHSEWQAITAEGKVVEPGLAIQLHDFSVEYYPDGSPKRFASDISVHSKNGSQIQGTVEVNKALKAEGWKIYQYGYDSSLGNNSPYSVFLMVKDPWLPLVYAGIFLMLAGALCLLLFMAPKTVEK